MIHYYTSKTCCTVFLNSPSITKYLTIFKIRYCFVSIIIYRRGLHVVFVYRSLWLAGCPCSGDFAWHARNCLTMRLDESTPFFTNERCASLVIFFSLLFSSLPLFFSSQSSDYDTGNHISLYNASQIRPILLATYIYRTFLRIFVSKSPATYVCQSLHSEPKPGLSHGHSYHAPTRAQGRRQFFCLLYYYFASQNPVAHAGNPRTLVRSPNLISRP